MIERVLLAGIFVGLAVGALAAGAAYQAPGDIAFGTRRHVDLLADVVPGLRLEGDLAIGREPFDLRLPDDTVERIAAPLSLSTLQRVSFNAGGRKAVAILAEIRAGESLEGDVAAALLAAFSVIGDGALIDAVNTGLDRFTAFSEPAVLTPGSAGDILIAHSSHSNSSQSYRTDALYFVEGGKFRLIDTVFTFSTRYCGVDDSQTPSFAPLARTADPHGGFVVTIRDRHESLGEDCADAEAVPGFDRTLRVSYRWDENLRNYIPESDALKILAAEAEKRF